MNQGGSMKVCSSVEEFFIYNDQDLNNILTKKFKFILKYYSLEDLKIEIYERLHKKKYIQSYRPFKIAIDPETGLWQFNRADAKFSTYIIKFIFNYIFAYYKKIDFNQTCLSLEDYNNANYCEENNTRLYLKNPPENFFKNTETRIQLEKVEKYLERKTKNKGTIIDDVPIIEKVLREIEKYGKKGCTNQDIFKIITDNKISQDNATNLEKLAISSIISSIEKKEKIQKRMTSFGQEAYFLNNPYRRSLYNLFTCYKLGLKDKEISQKFKMTVAGVAALKRSLRKEIELCCKEKLEY